MCIHIHICTHIHMCTHSIYTNLHIYMCMCVYIYVHTYICVHIAYTQTCTHTCAHVYTYAMCIIWALFHLCKFSAMNKCVKGMRMDAPQGQYFLIIYSERQKRKLLCCFSGTRREDPLIPTNCIALTMHQFPLLNF